MRASTTLRLERQTKPATLATGTPTIWVSSWPQPQRFNYELQHRLVTAELIGALQRRQGS